MDDIEATKSYLDFVRYCIDEKQCIPSISRWDALFLFMQQQALLGIGFRGLEKMKAAGVEVPRDVVLQWYAMSEQIKRRNVEMNHECARLTRIFESEGHHTAILKGQANERLYPDPFSRQSGDIDIYVDGGERRVLQLLYELRMIDNINMGKYEGAEDASKVYHHIHLPPNKLGIDVEVHFRPSSGVWNPFVTKKLQQFLEEEIAQDNELVKEGFRVPSPRFALIMQLAHIQKHFIDEGIGMRQMIDYYYLLKSEPKANYNDVASVINKIGLKKMAGAIMWVLQEVLKLEHQFMIVDADKRRGKMLLRVIENGGNWGRYSYEKQQNGLGRMIMGRVRHVRLFYFDPWEVIWHEVKYWGMQVEKIIPRIKQRSWTV